jgi:inward rectifier potassium channel
MAKKKKEALEDLGFGRRIQGRKRFINKDGSLNVDREGYKDWTLYHDLTESSWKGFFLRVLVFYIGINSLFAFIYIFLGVEQLSGVENGSTWENFSRCFFFSTQTFTTLGYGAISPIGMAANWVASLEALIGLLSAAVVTGLLLTRFTKPQARFLYSQNAVMAPFGDDMALMFRVANARNNKIMNLEAVLSATWIERENGNDLRKYATLNLERNKIFLFPLSWTIVHPINEESPFYGKTEEDLRRLNVEYLVLLEGYDESYNERIFSNTSYTCEEVIWNAKFKMMFHNDSERGTVLELDKINDIEILQ